MKKDNMQDKASLVAALAKKNLPKPGAAPGCTPCAFCNSQCVPAA